MRHDLIRIFFFAATLATSPARAEPSDWREMTRTLVDVADTLAAPSVLAGPEAGAYGYDLRRICQDDTPTFSVMLAAEDCPDGDCVARRGMLAGKAKALAVELEQRIQQPDAGSGSNAALFIPPGLTLSSLPGNPVEQLRLRSAHDLWLRAWSDPLLASFQRSDRDRWLLLSRVWCGVTRANAHAAVTYVDQAGFSPDDPAVTPAIINIAIHAAWDPALTRPLAERAEAAFDRDQLAGYYAGQLADIDSMASTGMQRVGTLFSCGNGAAYPDPPLADAPNVEAVRRRYGFGPLDAAIASRSRSCPAT